MPESSSISCAVTCVSATIRPSAPLDPRLPELRFRDARGYRGLDPRPRSSSAPRCSRVTPKRASLDQAAAQRLLQLTTDARTHSRASDSRASCVPLLLRSDAEPALVFDVLFYGTPTSPSRRRITRAASRDSPSEASPRRCKGAVRQDPESHLPTATPLAGDASIRPPFAAMAVGKQRWTARAEGTRSEGPSLTPPAAAERPG